jgi:hypothetical protein
MPARTRKVGAAPDADPYRPVPQALTQYTSPFTSVNLHTMAAAFSTSVGCAAVGSYFAMFNLGPLHG